MDKKKRPQQFVEIFPNYAGWADGYPNPKKGRKPRKNKLKEIIRTSIPVLFQYVPETDPDWEKFNELFTKKISARLECDKEENQLVEACLYDVIHASKQNEEAIILLQFFEVMLTDLLAEITDKELSMLRDTMKNLLVSLDRRYLNFAGEMAALHAMMASKEYRIEEIECQLPDSNSKIDFLLRKVKDNSLYYVEILNIHPDGDRLELKRDKMAQFFASRYDQKIASKKTSIIFYLIPVIWIDKFTLKAISDFFSQFPIKNHRVSEPMAYVTFPVRGKGNEFCHKFGTVSELFAHTRAFINVAFE